MATNKKFRIQNGVDIKGEMSFNNVQIIDENGVVATSSVQPAITSVVDTQFVNALNVTAFEALSAQSVTDISSFTTTDVSEGASLYFTEARVRASLQGGDGISFNGSTGEFSVDLASGNGITVSGNTISLDGSAITQDLVPAEDDVYSLGSPTKVWRDLYIGPGSLYINGTKILEDNSGTITMNADPGQNLSFGVTDGGSISFNAGDATMDVKSDLVLLAGKTITTTGGAATVFGGDVNLSGNNLCDIAAPNLGSDAANKSYVDGKISGTHEGDKEFSGAVVVQGDLTVHGTTTTVNSETLTVADNIIDVNSNVTSGTPTENAGLRVMRGDEPAAQMRWNEGQDYWEVFDGSAWTKVALSTSDLVEGSNLYYTDERVNAIVNPIKTGLENVDSDEQVARISADAVLQANIDTLGTNLGLDISNGDSDLNDKIDVETGLRLGGDSDLNDKIDVETGLRLGGDSDTLQAAKDYADVQKGLVDVKTGLLDNKDSDQDVLIAANAQAISDESSARGTAVTQLQSAIDANIVAISNEQQARGDGDTALQAAIDLVDDKVEAILGTSPETLDTLQEIVAAFEASDSGIQGIVNGHASRLLTAEGTLESIEGIIGTGALGTASSTLIAAINELHVELDDAKQDQSDIRDILVGIDSDQLVKINENLAAILALNSNLDAESQARASADTTLQTNINNEATARANADNALDNRIDQLEGSMRQEASNGDSALNDSLLSEIAARIAGDSDLGVAINVETGLRLGGDSDLNAKIDVETGLRLGADSNLNDKIDVETGLRLGADSDLNVKIDAEVLRATGVESDLQAQISGIIANTDEVALNSLAELVEAFQGADASLSGVIASNQSDIGTLEVEMSTIQPIVSGHSTTLVNHGNRITTLEQEQRYTDSDAKAALSGGLCIEFNPSTGEIKVDEVEAAAALHVNSSTTSANATALGGQAPSHYRINVYRVDGTLVN